MSKPALSPELLPELARQTALESPIATIHAVRIFRVSEIWQESALAELPAITRVDDLDGLRASLAAGKATLLIPSEADITYDQLSYLLQRHTGAATIFFADR